MASFPTSVKSFTTKNSGDTIQPAHINDLQDEVSAMQDTFINGEFRCSAYNNAVQSVNNDTSTALTLNTEDYDVGSMHDTGSNTSRITVPANAGGCYLIIGQTTFAADADGYRQLIIKKNGATNLAQVQMLPGAATGVVVPIVTAAVLAASDYVELYARHTAGAALDVGSASSEAASRLQAVRIW